MMISETLLIVLVMLTISVGIAVLFFLLRFFYRRFFLPAVVSKVKKELGQD